MARSTFFSFHYAPDCWRASQIKNSWVTQDRKSAGFFNSVEWEEVKKKQDSEIEKWIDKQLLGTSVTVVLIGSNTAGRKWINYEITSSHKKGTVYWEFMSIIKKIVRVSRVAKEEIHLRIGQLQKTDKRCFFQVCIQHMIG